MKIVIIPVLALSLFAFGCGKKEAPAPKIPGVKTVTLAPAAITASITLSGTVESKARAWLISPADGAVMAINKEEGEAVAKGDVLVLIMPLEQQNLLGQSKAEYDEAKKAAAAGAADSEAALKAASERYEAAKKLYKPFPVVSPVDGVVILRKIDIGENVAARQNLLAVADLNRLVVKTAVSEKYSGQLSKGQSVKVKIDGAGGNFPGQISLVSPGINAESRTADIEIKLPQGPRLRPGMAAEIELAVAASRNAVVLPQDALVVKPDGSRIVFVIEDSKAVMTKVETGIEANEKIEITKGLKFGQAVAVAGQENLKDGVQVKIAGADKIPEGKNK
ncbi:MAG: efflux RND transporter periplasmic adaptor subunit [Elusimicrobia bacterium]|nr:efflux RND transporter periplasmic adaptor subunit [Elusimicrobiota bacterium]